ncbi:MAG: chaperone protein htpG [Cyclobacteriaceae bacterium]|nr:MAG: chaperone protein htpG [Cyclobacteriaceae bacterium]
MTTLQEKGTLSINTENIFPIIKKFLYSDHEIFLRELVSNAVDATQKLKKLASMGEYTEDLGDLKIEVSFDKKKKTITVSDKGIGMTADEVKKYINQIAFSGAAEFVEKFKDKTNASDIIGKFGLGFYSAFMVAEKVELITRSYQADETGAVRWSCDGSTEFELHPAVKKQRGTDVILHIAKDAEEFLDEHRLLGILEKYCRFLPVEIKFGTRQESIEDGADEAGKKKHKTVTVDRIINNPRPLWTQSPSDLKDEDYLKFYKELYPLSEDPLFWIHLNVDFPFNLTGILYFPKVKNDFELHRNKIQLYCRQVFITDEVKDIVPDFLMLLHGVIDSPDIPLNVSRSYLQSDSNVKKISQHITKKVADKLQELFKKERESFEKKWDDISLFVKYGMIADEKFYDRAKEFVLLKNTEGKYFTLDEYHDKVKTVQTDKNKNVVYLYTTDAGRQDSFIQSARSKGYDVLIMDGMLDAHFINTLEYKLDKTHWKRVDSDTPEKLIAKDDHPQMVLSADEQNQVKSVFEKAADKPGIQVTVEALAPDELPAVITLNEFARRMKDMARVGGGAFPFGTMPDSLTVAVNGNHALIQRILKAENEAEKTRLARQAIDLALLSQHMLTGTDLTAFIKRSVDFIS